MKLYRIYYSHSQRREKKMMTEDKDLMVSLKAAKMTIENAINYIDNAADIMDWYIALNNGVLD